MRKGLVVMALICILITSCAPKVECNSTAYNELTQEHLQEWETIITLSLTRFPGNLSPIIRDLERILNDFKNLEIAGCYQPAHDMILAGMALDLDGVKQFDSTGNVSDQFQQADAQFAAAQEELQKLDQ